MGSGIRIVGGVTAGKGASEGRADHGMTILSFSFLSLLTNSVKMFLFSKVHC
jgi:hypothetical protein